MFRRDAEKAERERDEARTNATYWENTSAALTGAVERWQRLAENPRPLTPDAITDEMVLRYLNHSWGATESNIALFEAKEVRAARSALIAALTEPPARPEGAEDIEAAFGTWERSEYLHAALDGDDLRSIADHIAEEMNR